MSCSGRSLQSPEVTAEDSRDASRMASLSTRRLHDILTPLRQKPRCRVAAGSVGVGGGAASAGEEAWERINNQNFYRTKDQGKDIQSE